MRAAVDREALVVGMTLVPGLVSRNRSFALFENPDVRRARVRAALLRGIVRQLTGIAGARRGVRRRRGHGCPRSAVLAARAGHAAADAC